VSQSGLYSLNIGMRTNTSFPFQTLSMVMTRSQKSEPKQHSDTVSCNIVDREGKLLGRNGISSNEVRYHVRDIAMADSDSLFVCISHCMRRESLPGLTEVGLQLVRTNQ
jgi:gliding motility-associated lipoprotein GldH